ncbi:TPA: DUF5447 family protein [Pseudomonas aeruginosa]|nr:DUF5447 family protein [Pseudomonas aeruginosa]
MTASPYYLRQTHAPDCACSVCWSARQAIPLHSPSPCPDCRPPGLPYLEDGRWLCRPRSFCAKHDPSGVRRSTGTLCTTAGNPRPSCPCAKHSNWRADSCSLRP